MQSVQSEEQNLFQLGSRWQSLACSLVAGFRLKPNGPELCMPHVALDDVGIPILYMPPPTLDSFFVDAASQLYCLMVFPLFCLPLPQSLSLHFGTAFKWLRQQSGKLYLRSHSHIECSVIWLTTFPIHTSSSSAPALTRGECVVPPIGFA